MTKKEAKKMKELLNQMPPKYDDYEEGYNDVYRIVGDEEWNKMVRIINQLRDMYSKKLYLEGNNERKS